MKHFQATDITIVPVIIVHILHRFTTAYILGDASRRGGSVLELSNIGDAQQVRLCMMPLPPTPGGGSTLELTTPLYV